MKMPISMMVYIINKLIEDKKEFTISSSSMDLRFKFTPTDSGMWLIETGLGAVDYVGRLSFSYFDRVDVDIFKAIEFGGGIEEYDVIGFTMDCSDSMECFQNILIRDKNPDLTFWA